MVSSTKKANVAFLDGYVFEQNWVAIAGYLIQFKLRPHARVYTLANNKWTRFDLKFDICSIVGTTEGTTKPTRRLYCLGRNGRVEIKGPGGPRVDQITDVEKLGQLINMSGIAGVLYACGSGGQIYRGTANGWLHFDEGVADSTRSSDSLDITCVDGIGANNLYAVGEHGLIFHYDGIRWNRIERFTNVNLHWVCCVSPTEVYVCGAKGTVFRGALDKWQRVPVSPHIDEGFWCVKFFNGKVYIAGNTQLYEVDGNEVHVLDTGLSPAPDGHRLHANDGVLWSFGTYHLCFFDGKKWTYVKHPDNAY